jgi:hypothetical protein
VAFIFCILVPIGCKSSEFASGNQQVKKEKKEDSVSEDPQLPEGDAKPKKTKKKGDLDEDGDDSNNLGEFDNGGNDALNFPDLGSLFTDDDAIQKNGCIDPPKTTVNLRTQQVRNATAGEIIEYEIFVTDCNGKRLPINANYILFDIDAEVSQPTANSYTIENGPQGTMQVIEGVDLFGKAGPNYFHSRTDQTITINNQTKSAILKIGLLGERYSPIGNPGAPGSFQLPTYLRFGNAQPVQQNVLFVE